MKTFPCTLLVLAALTALSAAAISAEREPTPRGLPRGAPPERLDQIERRLEQIASQQEQLLRQMRSQAERMEQRAREFADRRDQWLHQGKGPGPAPRPGPRLQAPGPQVQPPPAAPESHPVPGNPPPPPALRHLKGLHDALGLVFLVWIVCNVLLAIWIFTDQRKRGHGPAIFVALALIAGIPAAIIYALVRLGDRPAEHAAPSATPATPTS